jgi:phosphoribosylformimino-5-aminoimidazole carboxamide ribotide isomerase
VSVGTRVRCENLASRDENRTVSFTVYASVDIADGKCVRPLQGRFGSETVYSDDPGLVAVGLSRAGARWLHIVDLEGAVTGIGTNREVVLETVKLAACPVQAGGGLRTVEDVTEVLAAGANRAVVGAPAMEDPLEVRAICRRFKDRIAVSLDARGREDEPDGWTLAGGVPVVDAVKELEDAGALLFIYRDVGRDGTLGGPDIEGLSRLTELTDRPVIASGGIGSLEELRRVARLRPEGVHGAIIGRALYEHKFGVGEANYVADEASSGKDLPPLVE